jgi:outer membrane lipoprotein-sorting protein
MIKKIIISLFMCVFAMSANAKVDGALITKAEKYLNNLSGITGDFSQKATGQKEEKGMFYMLRPGKLRLDYNRLPIQLISDGSNMFFFDKSLDQITTIPVTSTPASILVRKNIDLRNDDIKVVETSENSDVFDLKLILKDNPGLGEMWVSFSKSPMVLNGWQLKDATGTLTTVQLNNIKTKTKYDKGFFNVQRHKTSTVENGDSFYE